jgi:hypothetical protein
MHFGRAVVGYSQKIRKPNHFRVFENKKTKNLKQNNPNQLLRVPMSSEGN